MLPDRNINKKVEVGEVFETLAKIALSVPERLEDAEPTVNKFSAKTLLGNTKITNNNMAKNKFFLN